MKPAVGTAFTTLCLGLTLLAADAPRAQSAAGGTLMKEDAAVIRLRPGQLPEVRVSGALLHRLLAAELAAQGGDFGAAAPAMLELARTVGEVRLARRAVEFYLAGENVSGALDAVRAWQRLALDDAEAREAGEALLALAVAAGQTEGVAAVLRARLVAAEDKSAAVRQAHAALSRLRDSSAALAILDEALPPEARQWPEARLAQAALAHAAGDAARAMSEARLALALQPDLEDAARLLLEVGLAADGADATDAAMAEARRFAARYPNARRLRLTLAQAYADAGRAKDALAELQAMAQHAPEDFDLLYMQAQVQLGAGRLAEARALTHQYIDVQLQRRAANRPDSTNASTDANVGLADAWALLARIAEREGQLDEAVALLEKIDDASRLHAVRLRQALLLARLNRVDDALAAVRALAAQDEDDAVRAALTAAQILRNAGRINEAIEELLAADEDFPDTVPVKYDLAMAYESQDNLAGFERLMRAIIALAPDHAQAYNALGYTLADRNIRLSEAQDLIARAHALRPDDPYILDSLGWVYFRLGRHDEALAHLQRAWDAQPQAEIAAHLGEVLWLLGQPDAARACWRDGAALEAENAVLRETLQRLGVLLEGAQ